MTTDPAAELALIREGADPEPVDERDRVTAGQLWHALLELAPAERIRRLDLLIDACDGSYTCFAEDHVGRLETLETRLAKVMLDGAAALDEDVAP